MNMHLSNFVAAAFLCILAGGCAGRQQSQRPERAVEVMANEGAGVDQHIRATAELMPTQGQRARGTIYFSDEPQGTRIAGQITGLTPGEHGFHIHEFGDCSAPDASSAGEHFNPTGARHGGPRTGMRHLGDLGNVTAGTDGVAHVSEVAIPGLPFSGPNSVLGKALVLHAGADDLTSQPSGNSGQRIACGVIRPVRSNLP